MLKVENLTVYIKEKRIINNLSFEINSGEIILLTGENGTGKTTLCKSISGFPELKKTGKIIFKKEEIINKKLNEIMLSGLYYMHQTPVEISGLSTGLFLKYALNNKLKHDGLKELTGPEFYKKVLPIFENLGLNKDFLSRDINHNFSGGEKKKLEIAQLILYSPSLVILDETEAGLDLKTRKKLKDIIQLMQKSGVSFIIISHDKKWLDLKINQEIKL